MRFSVIIGAVAAVAMTASATMAKDWTKVVIGTEGAYPPFNQIGTDGKVGGFDIEIGQALCAELKLECEFVTQDWDGIIPGLLAGKYDMILASMSITEERAKIVGFTKSYYKTPKYFMARKESGIKDISPEALAGKSIGIQSATTAVNFAQDLYKASDIRLYGKLDEANLDLQNGRIDTVLADGFAITDWLEKSGGDCCETVGEKVESLEHFGPGIGIAVRKEDNDLREMLDKAIDAIRENGTYAAINQKYFDFDIY